MLKLVIIGGRLQGSEVAYLGGEAGFEVILIDKDPVAPASKLCTKFICADIMKPDSIIDDILKTADMIIPTTENYEAVYFIIKYCKKLGIETKLAFDWEAYKISCSKIQSDKLFYKNLLPTPKYYPEGDFPYIVKPSGESGSRGVELITTPSDMDRFLGKRLKNYIIQEYIKGPSYSVEIIGKPGKYRTYPLTEILVDEDYDCYSALTAHGVDEETDATIRRFAEQIAELLELKGIMDLEVIVEEDDIKILEIDARFPSQTPIVIYTSCGINYVKEIYDICIKGKFEDIPVEMGRHTSLIHYYIKNSTISELGEHIMVEGDLLRLTPEITDEAMVISDYEPGKKVWRGMFVYSADSCEEMARKAEKIRDDIKIVITNETRGK